MTVPNHHCDGSVKYVVNIRDFFPLEKAPFFDPRLAGDSFFTPGAVRIPLEIYKFIFHSLPPAPSV
jgi:hypothetical protein